MQRTSWSESCKPDIHVELRSKTSTVRHNELNSEHTDEIHFISSSNVSPTLLLQRITILPLVKRLQSFSWRSESGTDVEPQWGKSKNTDLSPDPPMDVFRMSSVYTPAIQHHNTRHNTEQKTLEIENISKECSAGKETVFTIIWNSQGKRWNTLVHNKSERRHECRKDAGITTGSHASFEDNDLPTVEELEDTEKLIDSSLLAFGKTFQDRDRLRLN